MRYALLLALALTFAGCDACTSETPDAGVAPSALEAPGLPRPPTAGLPPELRPPR